MPRRNLILIVLALAVAAAVTSGGRITFSTVAATSTTPTLTLTNSQNSTTVAITRATTITVSLAQNLPGYTWSTPISSFPAVEAQSGPTSIGTDGSMTATFAARMWGQATLSAEDVPNCIKNVPPCGLPELGWSINVLVAPEVIDLTAASNGSSITLFPDAAIRVHLQNASTIPMAWTVPTSSSSSTVQRVWGTAKANGNSLAIFTAAADGNTTLAAVDNPTCTSLVPPCEIPAMNWRVKVAVSGPPPPG